MKLKYYLRGVGIGVIITTLLFMIVIHVNQSSEEETVDTGEVTERTIAEALEGENGILGTEQVTVETIEYDTEETTEVPVTEMAMEVDTEAEADAVTSEPVAETVSFTIAAGESPTAICAHLQEQGIVEDGNDYLQYLISVNLHSELEVGTFQVSKGQDYEALTYILTTSEYEIRNGM